MLGGHFSSGCKFDPEKSFAEQPNLTTPPVTNPPIKVLGCFGDYDSGKAVQLWGVSLSQPLSPVVLQLATSVGTYGLNNHYNGQKNHDAAKAYEPSLATFPAIKYCDDFVYGGFSDWYLPSRFELRDLIGKYKNSFGYSASAWASSTERRSGLTPDPVAFAYNADYVPENDYEWSQPESTGMGVICVRRP